MQSLLISFVCVKHAHTWVSIEKPKTLSSRRHGHKHVMTHEAMSPSTSLVPFANVFTIFSNLFSFYVNINFLGNSRLRRINKMKPKTCRSKANRWSIDDDDQRNIGNHFSFTRIHLCSIRTYDEDDVDDRWQRHTSPRLTPNAAQIKRTFRICVCGLRVCVCVSPIC